MTNIANNSSTKIITKFGQICTSSQTTYKTVNITNNQEP